VETKKKAAQGGGKFGVEKKTGGVGYRCKNRGRERGENRCSWGETSQQTQRTKSKSAKGGGRRKNKKGNRIPSTIIKSVEDAHPVFTTKTFHSPTEEENTGGVIKEERKGRAEPPNDPPPTEIERWGV